MSGTGRQPAPPTIDELRARVTERGPWFAVPADARPTRCTSCDAMIFFVETTAGKPMPVDVLVPGGAMPRRGVASLDRSERTAGREGRGVSHFATCPSAAEHRGVRASAERPAPAGGFFAFYVCPRCGHTWRTWWSDSPRNRLTPEAARSLHADLEAAHAAH